MINVFLIVIAGFDYFQDSSEVIFQASDVTTSVKVEIVDDDVVEQAEIFSLSLTTTQPNVNIATFATEISVLDNDGEIT